LIHIPFALLFFSSDSTTVFSESTAIVKLQSPDMQAAEILAWTLPVSPEGVMLAGFQFPLESFRKPHARKRCPFGEA
jgi:hypothetical protein